VGNLKGQANYFGLEALDKNGHADTAKAADLGKTGSCHLFRHACATHMLENGADTRMIQALLGHAKLETTQVYTHLSIKQLQQVHAATHPSSRGYAVTGPAARIGKRKEASKDASGDA